jgi:Protein of unknown function (DUF3667)
MPPASVRAACLNCRSELTGPYCASCGQSSAVARLTLRTMWFAARPGGSPLDIPLARTLIDMTLRPWRVASDYAAGRRVVYVHPLEYCLLGATFELLLLKIVGFGTIYGMSQPPAGASPVQERLARLSVLMFEYIGLVTVLVLPILAWLLRLVFRGAQRNAAETLSMCLFVYGHTLIIQGLSVPLGALSTPPGLVLINLVPFVVLGMTASKFYPGRLWANVLMAVAAHLAFAMIFVALTLGAMAAIVTLMPTAP